MHSTALALIAVLTSAGLAIATTPAAASCAGPSPTLSPPSGTALPADPRLYLFVPVQAADTDAGRQPVVSVRDAVSGEAIESDVRPLDGSGDLDVYSIWIDARDRVVDVDDRGHRLGRYRIGAAAEMARRTVEISDVRYRSDWWSCSHTEAVIIEGTSNAAAYRLEWLDGDGVGRGRNPREDSRYPARKQAVYLPPSMRALFAYDTPPPPAPALLASGDAVATEVDLTIGHHSCLGDTIDPGVVATEREMRLVAIFSDSSSEVVGAGPVRVSQLGLALPRSLVGASVRRMAPAEPAAEPVAVTAAVAAVDADASAPACGYRAALLYAGVSGLLALLVAAALRLRQRAVTL